MNKFILFTILLMPSLVICQENKCVEEHETLREVAKCLENTLVPSGMVAAFNLESGCPSGWTRYEPAAGRTIIGVRDKPHDNLPERQYRETGGTQFYLKTIPSIDLQEVREANREGLLYSTGISSSQISPQPRGGKAVAVMPPYVTLHYCEKR